MRPHWAYLGALYSNSQALRGWQDGQLQAQAQGWAAATDKKGVCEKRDNKFRGPPPKDLLGDLLNQSNELSGVRDLPRC